MYNDFEIANDQPWWTGEEPLTMAEAGKRYPRPASPSTVFRHTQKTNRYGVQLESFLSGSRRLTTLQAIERYLVRTTNAANGTRAMVSSSDRVAMAEAELDAMG